MHTTLHGVRSSSTPVHGIEYENKPDKSGGSGYRAGRRFAKKYNSKVNRLNVKAELRNEVNF